jgi:hypothetical protein
MLDTAKQQPEPEPAGNNGESVNRLGRPPIDPFDPANLRLDPDYLKSGAVKKLLTAVPVRRPNPQDFNRTHPDYDYRLCGTALIEWQQDRETYLILPNYAQQLEGNEFHPSNLYLATNRQKVIFLWPVKLPRPGQSLTVMHSSALEAAEKAIEYWVRVAFNSNSRAYDAFKAENQFGEPEWPELTFREILQIAFKDRIIAGPEHPVMQKLRGAIH